MTRVPDNWLPTRTSILKDMREGGQTGWERFLEAYGKLLYSVAVKAGLNDAEAKDAVQETLISLANGVRNYDRARGRFKSWLLNLARWKITDQLRKRRRDEQRVVHRHADADPDSTATIDRVADPSINLDLVWDQEWEREILDAATERVKRAVAPKQFQIFQIYVLKKRTVREVADLLKVSAAQVYVASHRVSARVKQEVRKLEASGV